MRTRLALLSLGAFAACAWFALAARDVPADPTHPDRAPAVVLLEGDPEATETRVILRAPASGAQPRVLGVVPHIAGSACRGTLAPFGHTRAYVVAAEHPSRRGSTYHSALWRVEDGAAPVRLRGSLTDASRALVTARGTVIVQSGHDGDEPSPEPSRALRERVDALTLDAVDPDNGASRTLWAGRGMIAYLAARLRDDEALVYHVHAGGAALFALDAATGATRMVIAQMEPLARDFSYDPARDDVTFARASARRDGTWEVVTVAARGPDAPVRVRWRGESDHLMPFGLRAGAVVISLPGDRGLARLDPWPAPPTRLAPLGDGADEALDESADGRWIAFRHRAAGRELIGLHTRADGRTVTLDRPGVYTEFVGFVAGGAP